MRAAVVGSAFSTPVVIRPIYRCEQPNVQLGQRRCLSVAGKRIDETIAAEMLRAIAPMAIEAAEEAERMLRVEDQEGGASLSWSCSRPNTMHRSLNAAMALATPTIA